MIYYLKRKLKLHPFSGMVILGLVIYIVSLETDFFSSRGQDQISRNQSQAVATSGVISSPAVINPPAPDSDPDNLFAAEQKLEEQTRASIEEFDPSLASLLANKKFRLLRERLLKIAAIAVADDDKNRLGYILNLLGQIAIQEQDLYTAEVYLKEALDIFSNLNDDLGSAQVYLQLGRTHLKSRQIARIAGSAYDELQVGRWYLANKIHDIAKDYILASIRKNLSINRYGSAASAYESLATLYFQEGNIKNSRDAVFESARLYSASGKTANARKVLKLFPESVEQQWKLAALDREIEANYKEYKNSILQIERARDYRRLYHYYRNKDDQERAWKFRLLANESLAQVSKRALFHRQQGVLAILYNSNSSMELAADYFVQAKQTFDFNGMNTLSDETEKLNNLIY